MITLDIHGHILFQKIEVFPFYKILGAMVSTQFKAEIEVLIFGSGENSGSRHQTSLFQYSCPGTL